LVIRVSIVLLVMHQSTRFLYSKPLLNEKMKKSHSVLFQDFKVSKEGVNFKNYPSYINLLTITLRIFIVMMVVLEPIHQLKCVTMIEIQAELILFYTSIILYYKPYASKVYLFTTVINHMYMMFTYLFLQQQHRDHV